MLYHYSWERDLHATGAILVLAIYVYLGAFISLTWTVVAVVDATSLTVLAVVEAAPLTVVAVVVAAPFTVVALVDTASVTRPNTPCYVGHSTATKQKRKQEHV